MKIIKLLPLMLFILVLTNCKDSNSKEVTENKSPESNREYYQLKVYTFDSEDQVIVTDKYLKEAYLPGVKRLGINNIGVFKLRPNDTDTIQKTYVLTPFSSIEQLIGLEDQLNSDEQYLIAGRDYLNASYDQEPYWRIESTIMSAFKGFPAMRPSKLNSPRAGRIYELRSYGSPTEAYLKNKVEMFNDAGEIKLFERLEFNAVFYGEVISGSIMPNLMYMTAFSDQVSRDKHWEDFVASPEWNEMKHISKYQNNVSKFDIIFLFPTEYSDY
ncbi:NIPSNAP family protein [Hyunsoonleella aestuarii]|nr:NIPSNAP family protein [Hyunsoonleella aestuarii]